MPDTALCCRRVLELESQLAGVKEDAAAREAELRGIVEGLRSDKRELEAKAAGVDLQALQQGDALVAQVRCTACPCRGASVQRAKHSHTMTSMRCVCTCHSP